MTKRKINRYLAVGAAVLAAGAVAAQTGLASASETLVPGRVTLVDTDPAHEYPDATTAGTEFTFEAGPEAWTVVGITSTTGTEASLTVRGHGLSATVADRARGWTNPQWPHKLVAIDTRTAPAGTYDAVVEAAPGLQRVTKGHVGRLETFPTGSLVAPAQIVAYEVSLRQGQVLTAAYRVDAALEGTGRVMRAAEVDLFAPGAGMQPDHAALRPDNYDPGYVVPVQTRVWTAPGTGTYLLVIDTMRRVTDSVVDITVTG